MTDEIFQTWNIARAKIVKVFINLVQCSVEMMCLIHLLWKNNKRCETNMTGCKKVTKRQGTKDFQWSWWKFYCTIIYISSLWTSLYKFIFYWIRNDCAVITITVWKKILTVMFWLDHPILRFQFPEINIIFFEDVTSENMW